MIEFTEAVFQRLLSNLKESGVETHAITVYQHGKKKYNKAFSPYSIDAVHPVYSVTKSFTSIAFGYLWKEKKISLDTPWISFFPEYEQLADPIFLKVTLRNLLSMTMGHDSEAMVKGNDDWILNNVQKKFAYLPGTHFFYNSMCSYLIGRLVEKETHQQLSEWLKPRLFEPLGIHDYWWEKDHAGHELGGFGLHLKTEDLAKFGECLRCNGIWKGEKVIPEDWLKLALSKQVENDYAYPPVRSENRQGYGFYFWMCTHNGVRCSGLHGQLCFIQPENELVIAMSNATTGSQIILNNLFKAMYKPAETGKKVYFRIPPLSGKPNSPFEKDWFNRTYSALENPAGLESLKVRIWKNTLHIQIRQKGKLFAFSAMNGKWQEGKNTLIGYSSFYSADAMSMNPPRPYQQPIFASYAWVTPTTLQVAVRAKDCSSTYNWIIKFDALYAILDFQVSALYTMFPSYEVVLKCPK